MDYSQKPLKIFMQYISRHRRLFIIDMLFSVLSAAVDLIFPYVSKVAMNSLLPRNLYRTFFAVMSVMVIAYVFKGALMYAITVIGHRMGILTESDMRKDLFTHMQALSCSFYDKNRTGILLSRVTNDLFDVTELAHHGPENLLICSLTILGSLAIMFTLEWRLALILTLCLPLCLWFTVSQRIRMRDSNIEVKRKTGEISATIESSISGIRTSKAFANENIEAEKFESANELFRGAKVDYYKAMGLFHSGMEFTTGVMPVLVILVGGIFIIRNRIDYVDLVTFTLYSSTFVSPLRRLANSAETFMAGSAGFSRFLEIMRTNPDIQDSPDAQELDTVRGEIQYRDVCFSYDNGIPVLEHINLSVAPGQCLALVGPSGGGKTTISRLLPRFYDVTSGSVTIDGIDVRDVTQFSLRRNIGLLEQDVFMFAGSIRDNIRYGNPSATDEEIVRAAKLAEIHEEIMAFPDGYNSYIGERGVMLSGGQKQRISIARVFLKNPPILILDEATSALDTVTERKIQESLDRLSEGRTSIIIAHRLSTVKNADLIAVIEGEHLVEFGPHRELLEKNGAYTRLWEAQMVEN